MLDQALITLGQLTDLEREAVLRTLLSSESRVIKLRHLLALPDDTKDYYLNYILESLEGRILRYINWPCLPKELEPLLIASAMKEYKDLDLDDEASQAVTSVKRGDVSVQYATGSTVSRGIFNLGDYGESFWGWNSILNEFRRLRW